MQDLFAELRFPNLLNVRDLGIYATRDGRQLRTRSLLRADDLHRLTPEGVDALLDYGVRTVIDLRWPVDAKTHPNHFFATPGLVNHHHISLLKTSIDEWHNQRDPGPKEMFNCRVLDYAGMETASVLRAIINAPEGPVLFHCVSGKDRTGFIAALLLILAEVDADIIAQDYSLSTEKLREAYLAKHPEELRDAVLERVRCPPEQIHNMIAHLAEHYDGVQGYLQRIGLSDGEIDGLKARLV